MKKRILTIALVIALLATCFAGTYAYLTDADAAKNVMVMGNLDIEQLEYERAKENGQFVVEDGSYKLVSYTQDKKLLPVTTIDANLQPVNHGAGDWDATLVSMAQVGSQGKMQVFSNANAQDKFVVVTNKGNIDAYVRTLVALECGSVTDVEEWGKLIRTSSFMTDQLVWIQSSVGVVTIGDSTYVVLEYVYNGAADLGGKHENGVLPADETTYPSLCQVYMTAAATAEDVAALDGNDNGKYDILVLSQAVQADGFADAATALNAAFGFSTPETVATWLADVAE